MYMKNIYTLLFVTIFIIFSCTQKETIYQTTYVNEVVEDNDAPPYSSVTTPQIYFYIQKIFIDLIGREAFPDQLEDITTFLKDNDLSDEARETILDQLMESEPYHEQFWDFHHKSWPSRTIFPLDVACRPLC